MKAKKEKKVKTREIRIAAPSKALYDEIVSRATDSKRTIAKEAEILLEIQLGHRDQ